MSTMEVSTQEAAELLKVSHPALMQMLDTGVLDFCMVGTEHRIRIESLRTHKLKLDSDRKDALAERSAYDQKIGF